MSKAHAPAKMEAAPAAALSATDRENPEKLSGQALRVLAHRRGVSHSEAASLTDDRLRMQLRYITYRQYTEAD